MTGESAPTSPQAPGGPAVPAGVVPPERALRSVLVSAAAALGVEGMTNALGLPSTRRVVVALVDGLGRAHLRRFGGHAPTLRAAMADGGRVLQAAVPTTTAASLTSLGTGLEVGEHGIAGYDVLDPERGVVVNQLGGWDEATDPLAWQPHATVLERAAAAGVDTVTVSLPAFEHSALTRAGLRGGRFVAGRGLLARAQHAERVLKDAREPTLVYVYANELDKAGHRHGVGSPQWLHALEEVDSALRRLLARVPAGTVVLATGDHGMVDVPASRRVDYAALDDGGALLDPALLAGVAHTAGEPRLVQLHFRPDADEAVRESTRAAWLERYGAHAWVLTREEAVAAGWFGERVEERVRGRIGDLLIAVHGDLALYDGRRVEPTAFAMVGQHGAPTRAEREVPLLTWVR
ncbi:nucleotide pyrophosphatase/phosphodiesterase family protein [Micrococcus sp. 2A]|uniref:alkaline phosphatase family protein n=1 Tax=Micrococcus TaxID=1269 RepID=UPI002006CA1B|nr:MULTISPECIES: nucleotide pyrophosphatase/phosphodiesterase family protein [unclassified Micrococcus]MCK6094940.1 alkaline phosphatase family protein [Micrococcus sp. EYE_212]MCK6170887.1 alkaline phosphatase family protein [Micrococcus sp. EYE_162]